MIARRFAEFGPFHIAWDSPADPLFLPFLEESMVDAPPSGARVIDVTVEPVSAPVPAPAGREDFFFGDVRAFCGVEGVVLADGVSSARVALGGEAIEFRLHRDSCQPGAPFMTHGAPGMLAVAAREQGVFHMHAAVVTCREVPVLVVGQGRAGKTTTALSLIHAGGKWAGDDLALFAPGEHGIHCWGVARHFHLRPQTAALFDEVAAVGSPAVVRGEHRVDVALSRAYPDQRLPGFVVPRAIVMPEIADQPVTTAEVVDRADALGPLLQASAMIVANELGRQQEQINALGELVGPCVTIALRLGRDGLSDPLVPARAVSAALAAGSRE